MLKRFALGGALAALVLAAACDSRTPVEPGDGPPPDGGDPAPRLVGLVEVTLTGIGSAQQFHAEARPVLPGDGALGGASPSLTPLPTGSSGGIQLESASNGSFTEGTRGLDGQRYVHATFRVRNAAADGTPYGVARSNLTFVPVETASTVPGTAVSRLRLFDDSEVPAAAATGLAASLVPTGAVRLGDTLQMEPAAVDVLQVFQESEISAVTLPAGVTGAFPYGFVTRNPRRASDRVLPANPATDEWDGLVTFAFRLPLQADADDDPFTVSMLFLAMEDSETRVTEAIEEQTPAARAEVAARAAALSATTVTVLPGSPSTGYPGQRRICDVRTAGAAGAPTQTITMPGAYSHLHIFREGETVDACAADFTGGTTGRPGVGLPFDLTVRAMDRYGNVLASVADTIRMLSSDASTTLPSPSALDSGEETYTLAFHDYGAPVVTVVGTRMRAARTINVAGITRTWTGAASTDWHDGANWDVGVAPAVLDSVVVPSGTPNEPVLAANVNIGGVTVADGATLALGAFNLTASANVTTGPNTGGVTNTTGRVVLAGTAAQVSGILPRVQVTGTYSQTGNLRLRAPMDVQLGRLTNTSFRTDITSY